MPVDPKQYTVILIGDDGNPYILTKNVWQQAANLLDPANPVQVPIKQAQTFGTVLADIPVVATLGAVCVFVNVKQIVEGG